MSVMKPYPLKFEPIYKNRIWGGQKLKTFFGKDIPAGEKIGESWELADLPNGKSIVANGEFAGCNLGEVITKYPRQIIGTDDFTGPFPLLIKILDAEDILSVQVHPDVKTCLRMGTGEPKTECWYIISAAKDAIIYKGLKKGVSREQFAEAIEKGTVAEMLEKVPVSAGQCHFLPAGTAHSIGAGLLIAEIQTPSDTTYRVFDWNRVDQAGKPRQLHIAEAIESIDFAASAPAVTTAGRLVETEFFTIDKTAETKDSELPFLPGQMKVLVILAGYGKIAETKEDPVEFTSGDCLLLPAAYGGSIRFFADTEYLTITI